MDLLAGLAVVFDKVRPLRVEGFVDRMIADEAFGWAFNPKNPGRRVLVVARLEGKVVGEALADLPRRDLQDAGKGDGRHGFRLKIASSLSDEARRSVTIEAVSGLRRKRLRPGAVFLRQIAEPTMDPIDASRLVKGAPPGFLERCVGGVLEGWACNPDQPDQPPAVDVFDDEVFLGTVQADIERPRLQQSGAPAGARGFAFRLPNGREPPLESLRVRIANTRIELRRARPGAAAPLAQAPSAHLSPPTRPAGAPAEVALLIAGPGSAEAVRASLASFAAQLWPATRVGVVGGGDRAGGTAFGARDDQALRRWLAEADVCALLPPGQIASPRLASTLATAAAAFDAFAWPAEGAPPVRDPDLAVRLGAGDALGFALRPAALCRYEGSLARSLGEDGLGRLLSWSARQGFAWRAFDQALTGPVPAGPVRPPPRLVPAPPRRITLAVWSGWGAEPPAALKPLLAAAAGFDVEVLCPDPPPPGLAALTGSARGLRSLAVRLVDPPDDGPASALRRLGQAATGQAVAFCHGDLAAIAPETLREAAGWAVLPDVGCVSAPIREAGGAILCGLDLQDGVAVNGFDPALAGRDRPILAAPAAFLVVSRAALADVGGFRAGAPDAGLDLALRLREVGRRSMLLGGRALSAPDGFIAAWAGPRRAAEDAAA